MIPNFFDMEGKAPKILCCTTHCACVHAESMDEFEIASATKSCENKKCRLSKMIIRMTFTSW